MDDDELVYDVPELHTVAFTEREWREISCALTFMGELIEPRYGVIAADECSNLAAIVDGVIEKAELDA